ncbi:hypothetical protein Nepgr_025816 [Nepenthes gracilis]|uniref:U-box domain-containing protein n=1 Tax=Nepenthes gracilis TaxID=150966 RepID=A0AAD3T5Q4_NEPGR|nr:hypothetical protein Nepgr_025816 [Nepenthes gracilis]
MNHSSSMKEAQVSIPELFRCPITLDLLTDPVTLCTGQTYERSSIQKWLSDGNLTCPVTMQKLHDPSIVPNHTLHRLIDRWLQAGHCYDIGPHVAELKHTLESNHYTFKQKLQAIKQVRLLSMELPNTKENSIQSGFFELLLKPLFGEEREFSQQLLEFIEQALCIATELMPLSELGCLDFVIKEDNKFTSFILLLKEGTPMIKLSLCELVKTMAVSSPSMEEAKEISIIRGLINLLDHEQDVDVSGAGVRAISALCLTQSMVENLVKEGAVDSLVAYILRTQAAEKNWLGEATTALELILGADGGKESLMGNSNGIRALVKMVFRVSDHEGSESAVLGLMRLCCESKEAREEAISVGVLTQLLLLLQSQCSGTCKTKARMLLKLLTSM